MSASTVTSRKPDTSTSPTERTSSPSKWLLRQLEQGPLPKNIRDLLQDKRFSGRSHTRRPNTLPLRDCWLIDSEALEAFLRNEPIHVFAALDANGKTVATAETQEDLKGKGVRIVPLADAIGGM